MFSFFITNKKRLGMNATKFYRRFQATIVSYAANVEQTFKLGIFSNGFTENHYTLQVYIGIINSLIARVRNSGQDIAMEYIAPFFCLPFLFFNKKFRNAFSNYLLTATEFKFTLWLSSMYNSTSSYRSKCFTKFISYLDYDLKFILKWITMFMFSVLLACESSKNLLNFSSSRQASSVIFYVYRTIDTIFTACMFNDFCIDVTDPNNPSIVRNSDVTPKSKTLELSSKNLYSVTGSYFKIQIIVDSLFEVHLIPDNVNFDIIINFMVAIDFRVLTIFNVKSYVLKPISEGLSYNAFGYVYYDGFLNIFREVAASNAVHTFLATLLRQYGLTTVQTADGTPRTFPISFSDGIFEILSSTEIQLGYLFSTLFLPEESTAKSGKTVNSGKFTKVAKQQKNKHYGTNQQADGSSNGQNVDAINAPQPIKDS